MSAGAFLLRDITADDHDVLVALWVAAWVPVFPNIDFSARRGFIQEHLTAFSCPPNRARMLTENGKTVGFALVDIPRQELEQIAVHPSAQGSTAARLLLEDARALAGSRLALSVNTDNARALGFYQKHGFRITGEGVSAASGLPILFMEWQA